MRSGTSTRQTCTARRTTMCGSRGCAAASSRGRMTTAHTRASTNGIGYSNDPPSSLCALSMGIRISRSTIHTRSRTLTHDSIPNTYLHGRHRNGAHAKRSRKRRGRRYSAVIAILSFAVCLDPFHMHILCSDFRISYLFTLLFIPCDRVQDGNDVIVTIQNRRWANVGVRLG
ncbi:hypothetical protein DFH07DRAFT_109291 [Mycena maculata]|uniref:Uncharacterized protein n=1 Tax=Mycena maculata TaxID=230809 RepID=A0AAD7MWG4_9AGAR|nr:hypothetical protein DFH07DRAFT_109291 [Mycena maculata]